jgi:hypothetical protein
MFYRGEFDFETESRTFRSCDIKEICRLRMYWENTLLQLFGNSENLRDKIHAFCILTEDPKGYRSLGEPRMKGHGFCSVVSITPQCFGSLVLWGGANKDLSRFCL